MTLRNLEAITINTPWLSVRMGGAQVAQGRFFLIPIPIPTLDPAKVVTAETP